MKAIHYINQFFGQVGGEDAADCKPIFHDKPIGCSMMLNGLMPDVEVTNTMGVGDNYITNHTEEALKEIMAWLDTKQFDIFFAGPAFMAGRYGVGCGIVCRAIAERYQVPVITSMNEENPGVEEYKQSCYIFKGGRKATFMKDDMIVLITTFFVTSANSGTYVLAMFSEEGTLEPSKSKMCVWGVLMAALALVLLLTGGLQNLQTISLTAAAPFAVIMLCACWSFLQTLTADEQDGKF